MWLIYLHFNQVFRIVTWNVSYNEKHISHKIFVIYAFEMQLCDEQYNTSSFQVMIITRFWNPINYTNLFIKNTNHLISSYFSNRLICWLCILWDIFKLTRFTCLSIFFTFFLYFSHNLICAPRHNPLWTQVTNCFKTW